MPRSFPCMTSLVIVRPSKVRRSRRLTDATGGTGLQAFYRRMCGCTVWKLGFRQFSTVEPLHGGAKTGLRQDGVAGGDSTPGEPVSTQTPLRSTNVGVAPTYGVRRAHRYQVSGYDPSVGQFLRERYEVVIRAIEEARVLVDTHGSQSSYRFRDKVI